MMTHKTMLGAGMALLLLAGCDKGPISQAEAGPRQDQAQHRTQQGEASYYHRRFTGRQMANGERFDPRSNSAAHRTLPLGTVARVTNLENGKSAVVEVEDRGPYARGRIIDLSPSTADRLDMKEEGTARVSVTPLRVPAQNERRNTQEARR
jgi:rare lipoprotein A